MGLLAGAAVEAIGQQVPAKAAPAAQPDAALRTARAPQTTLTAPTPPLVAVAANRVVDTCAAADAVGIKLGMTPRHGRQICPVLRVIKIPSIPAPLVQARMTVMGREAYRLSPRVEPDPPLSLYFDLRARRGTAASALWSAAGLRTILAPLARALVPTLGHRLRIGVAANRLLARIATGLPADRAMGRRTAAAAALGRLGPDADLPATVLVVPRQAGAHLLAPLPVDQLWPLAGSTIQRLKDLGLYTIGAVAAAGAASLQATLGAEGLQAAWLAVGHDPTPVAMAEGPLVTDVSPMVNGLSTADRVHRGKGGEVGVQVSLWPPKGSLAGMRLDARLRSGMGLRSDTGLPLGRRANGPGVADGRRELPKLMQGLRRRFPGSVIRLGGDAELLHREQMLAHWDPWRIKT